MPRRNPLFPSFARRLSLPVALAAAAAFCPAASPAQEFGPPVPVSRTVNPSGSYADNSVSVADDGSGNIVAVWWSAEPLDGTSGPDFEIHFARSTDGGATWTDPQPLNTDFATDIGHDSEPTIATDGAGGWVTVWRAQNALGGTLGSDPDVLFSRSTDAGATWSAPQSLKSNAASDGGAADFRPVVVSDGAGNMVVVWWSSDSQGGVIGSDFDILVSRSPDNGVTWSPAAALNSDAAGDAASDQTPELATDGAGTWVTAWRRDGGTLGGDGDIVFARSSDAGATWSMLAPLNTNAAADSGMDVDVDLVADGSGKWVAVWRSTDTLGDIIGNDSDILTARSSDGAVSWSAPLPLNTFAAADSSNDTYPAITTDGQGDWLATWTSNRDVSGNGGDDEDLLASRSTDDGATWSAASVVSNPAASYGADYDAKLTLTGPGQWLAVWWSYDSLGFTLGTETDILMSRSDDAGATWSATQPVNNNAYADPFDYSAKVAGSGDTWVAVWTSNDALDGTTADPEVLFARSIDGGATWSQPSLLSTLPDTPEAFDIEPSIATDGAVWVVAWLSDGDILVSRSTDDGVTWSVAETVSNEATYDVQPFVATDGTSWIVTWASADFAAMGPDFDIQLARSSDGGATWTAAAPLNTNHASDTGEDMAPKIAGDGTTWIATWISNEDLSGMINVDDDVFFAVSTDDGATWSAPSWLNANATSDLAADGEVQIVADGSGNWIAAWASADTLGGTLGPDVDLLTARSSDAGQTWSFPQALNTNATADAGSDDQVSLASDGAGRLAAVWKSTSTLGGTIGFDSDILVAWSLDAGATWTTPEAMITHAAVDRGDDYLPSLASNGAGAWMVAWASKDSMGGLAGYGTFNVFATVASLCAECDDGNPCTQDSCNAGGGCLHLDAPVLTCRAAGASSLVLKNSDDDSRDSVSWKMSGAPSTSQAELGDPTTSADYVLCVYDNGGTSMQLSVPAGGTCNGAPCWQASGASGYRYKDVAGSSDGVRGVGLKGSTKDKTKVQVKAGGAAAGIAAPLLDGEVAVQLHNTQTDLCWGAAFSQADIVVSDTERGVFKAKAK